MKNFLCSFLIFGLFSFRGAAQPPPAPLTVAVYDFTSSRDAARLRGKMSALITANLTTETNLIMIERSDLKKALDEQGLGSSGMIHSESAAKIGQITGAKVLVSGQLIMDQKQLVVLANIMGAETGRLFATKVSGPTDKLSNLADELSAKIARIIITQRTNLVSPKKESDAERIDRIVKGITGTNRPSVSVNIVWGNHPNRPCHVADTEFGAILLKAGFAVVDAKSERKADIEIWGQYDHSEGPRYNGLFSFHSAIELKVHERRTGNILALERQEGVGIDATKIGSDRAAAVQTVDRLAEVVLPIIAR